MAPPSQMTEYERWVLAQMLRLCSERDAAVRSRDEWARTVRTTEAVLDGLRAEHPDLYAAATSDRE